MLPGQKINVVVIGDSAHYLVPLVGDCGGSSCCATVILWSLFISCAWRRLVFCYIWLVSPVVFLGPFFVASLCFGWRYSNGYYVGCGVLVAAVMPYYHRNLFQGALKGY